METAEKPPIVELKQVSKWFADPRTGERLFAVKGVDLCIDDEDEGEFIVLLGPSGCGKSTILNIVAGLLSPDEGQANVFGRPVPLPNPESVTVPQAYTCFPWLTALGNVELGLSFLEMPAEERRNTATQYLDKVGLGDRLQARPRELSGGMQQRVAIARTLAMKRPVVLMDEPFGALDAQTRSEMQQMLLQLWSEEKNMVLFITHDITEALLLADRIIVLSPRPATVIHDLRVPFPRPRLPSVCHEEQFISLSQALLQLLKRSPAGGQVRVTV